MRVMDTLEKDKKIKFFGMRMVIYLQAFVVLQVKTIEWGAMYDL